MIVVDASVTLKWVVNEPNSAEARTLASQDMCAPEFWISEAGNALWRRVRLGELAASEALSRLTILTTSKVKAEPMIIDAARALELATELNHPIYDCFYLALALREGTFLLTADKRFADTVRSHGRWMTQVKLLSEL